MEKHHPSVVAQFICFLSAATSPVARFLCSVCFPCLTDQHSFPPFSSDLLTPRKLCSETWQGVRVPPPPKRTYIPPIKVLPYHTQAVFSSVPTSWGQTLAPTLLLARGFFTPPTSLIRFPQPLYFRQIAHFPVQRCPPPQQVLPACVP